MSESESEFEFEQSLDSADGEEEEIVDADDFFVKRDSDDEVLPRTVRAQPYGHVKVKPMVYGDAEKYFGDQGMADVEPETVAKLLDEYVVEPDLSGLTPDDIRNKMEPLAPQSLLLAIMDASGIRADVSVDEDGEASVALQGNSPQ